jgi:mono/diheme cytochrome c family protein
LVSIVTEAPGGAVETVGLPYPLPFAIEREVPHLQPGAAGLRVLSPAGTIELMRNIVCVGLWICGLALPADLGRAQGLVERGKALVDEVARCGDCHTPKDAGGRRDSAKALKGAPMAKPAAPDITASGRLWATWKEEGFYHFLVSGAAPSGQTAKHPMPFYKLRPDDAEAVVAYLKTLK